MPRRGFSGFVTAMAREAARARRQAEVVRRRELREQAAALREAQRQVVFTSSVRAGGGHTLARVARIPLLGTERM